MKNMGKLLTAMITPFTANNELAVNACGQLAEKLVFEQGTDGVVLSGTTGESPTLTLTEKLTLYQTVVDRVGEHTTVIAGTGNYDTKDSLELTREAEDIGVHGIMLVTPYYNRPGPHNQYQHFKTIAENTNLPVMLYNVPKRTGIDMNETTILKLAEIDNIVAIKEASGDLVKLANLVNKAGDKIKVYSGDDVSLMPVLSLGGTGVVSVAAHLVGYKLKQVIDLFHANDVQESLKIYQSIHPLLTSLTVDTNPIPIKSAVNSQLLSVGGVRPPLEDLSEDDLQNIIATYRQIDKS